MRILVSLKLHLKLTLKNAISFKELVEGVLVNLTRRKKNKTIVCLHILA